MTTPRFTFRISPADPCLIEWRRNQPGAPWLYWSRRETPQEALDYLAGIGQVGFVIERQHPEGTRL